MARGSIIKKQNKNSSITYSIQYRDLTGKQIKKAIGPRKRDAERVLDHIMRQINQGEYRNLPNIIFYQLAKKWFDIKKTQVRPQTLRMYRNHLELRLFPTFGDVKLKSISQEMIERSMADLVTSNSISPETVRKCLLTLKSVLKKGVEWGYISRNPAEFISPPKKRKKRIEFLVPDEMRKLIEATPERHRPFITTACYTGMRASELVGLKWEDIDWKNFAIHVQRTFQKGKFFETKSPSSNRSIKVFDKVLGTLRKQKENQQQEGIESELVFTNLKGNPIDYNGFSSRVFKPALKKAGIKKINFHALRHSYTAALISAGENIKFVQRQLGHASISQTMDTYGHLLPDIEKEAPERLKKILT